MPFLRIYSLKFTSFIISDSYKNKRCVADIGSADSTYRKFPFQPLCRYRRSGYFCTRFKSQGIMDMQMVIWVAVLAAVAVVMLFRTFSKAGEKVAGNDHIFDEETGQRVNNWKYITEDDGE